MTGGPAGLVPVDSVHAFAQPPSLLVPGAPTGPLAGTPIGVKAVIDVAGVVTTAGSPDFADGRPAAARSAPCVRALVAAGATVVGITVSDEIAYSLSGRNVHVPQPVNVAAPGRTPGGSSVGSASAVAAGLVPLALGTDTGGSIRVPASYCGIVGWRPSHGAVSVEGVVPLAPSFDTVGLLARDIGLLAAAARVLLAAAPGPNPVTTAGASVDLRPVLLEDATAVVDPRVGEAVASAARAMTAELPSRSLGLDLAAAREAFRLLQGHEAWAAHGPWIEATYPRFGPDVARRFELASAITDDDVRGAGPVRAAMHNAVAAATAGGRVLVLPAADGVAPLVDADDSAAAATRADTLLLTCIAGLAGAPVVVAPGAVVDGLPVGLALVGAPGSDLSLLRWAAAVARPSGGAA
jgi:amidase